MASDALPPYDGFDRMAIAGTWRTGRAGKTATHTNPHTGETSTEIPLATADELNEAYARATEVQRKDEVVRWHIEESGAAAPAATSGYAVTLRPMSSGGRPGRSAGTVVPPA
ncbi:hypothetical protein [Blastococcus saxobsidens]|uniref:Uncharacterized protein n=1 Tax=Blastococcus saxobsidens TaxID=138336 RepID=A0A4Q7Y5U7_9ACTN|nr:hypothetical protein [Blastococcus saxobsidens]RZU31503.1 hypothetical protein BKA19_1169 [Blastococcus saxobsidens]